jgi:hypothetical protein
VRSIRAIPVDGGTLRVVRSTGRIIFRGKLDFCGEVKVNVKLGIGL